MKNKKLLAIGLATVMAASAMVVPAMADSKSQTVKIAGTTNAATVKVTIAGSKKVVLNPYKMAYTVTKGTTPDSSGVVAVDNSIINKSGVPLKVTFEATPTVSGDMKLSPVKLTNEKTKLAYLVFGIQDGTVSGKTVTKSGAWGSASSEKKTVLYTDATTTTDANDSVYYLKSGDASSPSGAAFAIYGNVVSDPKKTGSDGTEEDDGWTNKDKVNTTIKFTFLTLSSGATSDSVYGSATTETESSSTETSTNTETETESSSTET